MTIPTSDLLAASITRLDEDRAIRLVERGLEQGVPPTQLLEQSREGMEGVARRYAAGRYFLADMLVAAHIFRRILGLLFGSASPDVDPALRPIVIGTVEGDIHDIGKNIAVGYLRSQGLPLIDLGSNVSSQRFVAEVEASDSSVVCLSGLMSTCLSAMRRTVRALTAAGLRERTSVLIGGAVNESASRYVGADYWAEDCIEGVEICRRLLEGDDRRAAV